MNKSIKIDVGRIFRSLLSKWYVMAIVGLLLGGIVFNWRSSIKQQYSASVSLYSAVNGSVSENTALAKAMQAYASVIMSNKISDRAASIIGDYTISGSYIRSVVWVNYSQDSPILYISANDPNPTKAVSIVNAVAEAFMIEAQNLTGKEGVQILDKASEAYAVSTGTRRYTVLAMIGGVMATALVLVIMELVSDRVYRVDDAELNGKLEVIGIIPDQKGV
jgi:capsular polysaccharide biosynthesis protein